MDGPLERGLAALERLNADASWQSLSDLADSMGIPRSAAHRLLTTLVETGYARQDGATGLYASTLKQVSISLKRLSKTNLVEAARPILDTLAERTGELARLSVVDGYDLVFVAKAQGAKSGLRYDPDAGNVARLSCSASGAAWFSTLTDDQALEIVYKQGFGKPGEYGPNAPTGASQFLEHVNQARSLGYGVAVETFERGTNALAAPIIGRTKVAVGVVSVAGPSVRLDKDRIAEFAPAVISAAQELSQLEIGGYLR